MKLYKKFTSYLLENQPLLWHTKVLQLLFLSILLWIISFALGYAYTSYNTLNEGSVSGFYFESGFFYFNLIFDIIVIVFWAFYYYRNSALRNFYPISRFYLLKLFCLLFIGFIGLVSAYIPFTEGAFVKTGQFYDEKEIKAELKIINLAGAFLPQSSGDYTITNRVYPNPFPLKSARYDKNNETWSGFDYYSSKVEEDTYYENKLSESHSYIPRNRDYVTTIDNQDYIFYTTKKKYDSKDSCNSRDFIKDFHVLDAAKYQLRGNSVLNYSNIIISNFYQNENKINHLYEYVIDFDYGYNNGKEYKLNYAESIHNLVRNKSFDSISKIVEKFVLICNKYKVYNNIDARIVLKYLKITNFEDLNSIVSNYHYDNYGNTAYSDLVNQNILNFSDKNFIIALKSLSDKGKGLFYKQNNLKTLYRNFKLYKSLEKKSFVIEELILTILFITLFISYFFFLFEFTNIISLIIAIPIIGALIILIFLFVFLLDFSFFGSSNNIPIVFESVIGILILTYLILLKSKGSNKTILTLFMNITYMILPYFVPLFLYILYDKMKHYSYDEPCNNTIIHEPISPFYVSAPMVFMYVLLSIFLFILTIKMWKAKEE